MVKQWSRLWGGLAALSTTHPFPLSSSIPTPHPNRSHWINSCFKQVNCILISVTEGSVAFTFRPRARQCLVSAVEVFAWAWPRHTRLANTSLGVKWSTPRVPLEIMIVVRTRSTFGKYFSINYRERS